MLNQLKSKAMNFSGKFKKINLDTRKFFLEVLLVFGVLFCFVVVDLVAYANRIHHGVEVIGCSLGGLTKEQATHALNSKVESLLEKSLTVQYSEKGWRIEPPQFNLKVSVAKTVDKAFAIGRHENLVKSFVERINCWIKPNKVYLVYSLDQKSLSSFIAEIAKEIDKEPQNATLKIGDDDVEVVPSEIGVKVKKALMFALIKNALVNTEVRKIEVLVDMEPPEITEAQAEHAIAETKLFISAPVLLKYDKYLWELDKKDIAELIEFVVVENNNKSELHAEISKNKVVNLIEKLTSNFNIEAKNAEFKVDGENVTVQSSKNGEKIDAIKGYEDLKSVLSKPAPREVILIKRVVEPEISTEKANAMGIEKRISTFTTRYDPTYLARVHNIHILADELDETIVPPGEIFSFNEVIGPRTVEKGYREAMQIQNGELVPAIGGGVCQVATTLFNTVFFAGYPVAERHNHSFFLSKYPVGRDAAVSYTSPDFKFKNDTSAYLLIKTAYTSKSVTISFYSTDFKTEVTFTTSPFTNIKSFDTKHEEDPTLLQGESVVEQEGILGRDVTVFRVVKRNGEIVRENKFFSRYKPRTAIIKIGTMPTSETTETTVAI